MTDFEEPEWFDLSGGPLDNFAITENFYITTFRFVTIFFYLIARSQNHQNVTRKWTMC